MSTSDVAEGVLEYYSYRFGRSGLVFRGPKPRLSSRYVAVIGGTETYGKFVAEPYPSQLEAVLGLPVANFGCMHASVDIFAKDEALLDTCRNADVTVIQIMGAANNSNRFYSVHPRRNDRFLKAAAPLRDLFPSADFADFNFTRHMLRTLAEHSPEAFETLRNEVRGAWTERMKYLIDRIGGRIVLLWMSNRRPDDAASAGLGDDPLFVDRAMLEDLRDDVFGIVEVIASDAARDEGLENKIFAPAEAQAAAEVPGPQFHLEAAMSLADMLSPIFESESGRADMPAHPAQFEEIRASR